MYIKDCSKNFKLFRINIFLIYLIKLCFVNSEIYVYDSITNKSLDVFNSYEMSIGSPIPNNGIFGYIVVTKPENACKPVEKPPKHGKNDTFQWFAIVNRDYQCKNEKKIFNVISADFDGIILYTKLTKKSEYMFYSTYDIPIILMTHLEGTMLASKYTYNKNFYVYITKSSPFNYGSYLIPFYIVIGICVTVIISFSTSQIIEYYRENRKKMRNCLSKKHLKKIVTIIFRKGDHYDVCAICLDEFVEGIKLRVLPCSHAYHLKCIDPWLTKKKKVCPICKGKVIVPGMTRSECSTDSETDNQNNRTANERTPLINNQSESINYSNNMVFPIPNRAESRIDQNNSFGLNNIKRFFTFNFNLNFLRANQNNQENNSLSRNFEDSESLDGRYQPIYPVPSTSNA